MSLPLISDMTSESSARRAVLSLREIVCLALISALMLVCQIAFAPLPNVEVVSLIIMAGTLVYGWKMILPLYVFVLMEGLIFGFALWWFGYLYVWLILIIITRALSKANSYVLFAVAAGCFGLFFGALFAIMDIITGGVAFAFTKWVSGIPFDLIHCASNAVISFLLLRPLKNVLEMLTVKH